MDLRGRGWQLLPSPSPLFLTALLFSVLFSACTEKEEDLDDDDVFVVIDHDLSSLHKRTDFAHDTLVGGAVENTSLVEASGIAVSRSNPRRLWSHNDSGHAARLYRMGDDGADCGVLVVQGAGSRDWEDICIGPGPEDGIDYIYVGDIGDNHAQYGHIVIYRIREPEVSGPCQSGVGQIPATDVERMEFTYPDGPRDAETLMIDPWTRDLYIVSKRDYRSVVYRARYPQSTEERTELERLCQLPFNWAVGGDISADGRHIAIKDRNRVFYWQRNLGESVVQALTRKPELLPYIIEPKGEAFGWGPEADSYFTVSEKVGTPAPILYGYSR